MTIDTPQTVEEFVALWYSDDSCEAALQECFD